MKIYISGAITSRQETYRAEFKAKQKELEDLGHTVLNPATLPMGLENNRYLPICLQMLDSAEAIYMFNHWEVSKGALIEKAYAEYQGKEVMFEENQ